MIVGGGTAGWLTAAWLAKHLGTSRPGGVQITLIESADIGTVGVGEGTFPTLRSTLAALGSDEAQFMRESSAAFKQGIRFVDWAHPPGASARRHYYHPFALPHQEQGLDLLPYWLLSRADGRSSFADAVTLQEKVCDAGCAPKRPSDPGFRGPMSYAYHVDAVRLGRYLRNLAVAAGVRHLVGNVERVHLDERGAIESLETREHGLLRAGLYVDCSGFRAQLIGQVLGVPFRSRGDCLFVDRAIAIQVPYARPETPIPPYTISTAQESGWIWDIGLEARRGVGYVYSSRHSDDDRAEQLLRAWLGAGAQTLPARQLKFELGYRERHWAQNCVAVGLAGGFLEPLESTGIVLIEAAAYLLASLFPHGGALEPAAAAFNRLMTSRYERIVDFIKMHYFLSQRRDTAFWRDNTDPRSATESLLAHLQMWRHRPPGRYDFVLDHETFAAANYQFILYGMGFETDLEHQRAAFPHQAQAVRELARVQLAARRAAEVLPPHRQVLRQIYEHGFAAPDAHAADELPRSAALLR